jgi:phosphoribosyl 1,2-cyclic phosphate phosphodiesterase
LNVFRLNHINPYFWLLRKIHLKITFLGTGTSQGVPLIGCPCKVCQSKDFRDNRLRSSVHIETEDLSLVIDTGPDFRQQMLRAGIKKMDAVLFTHGHKDHTAGFDDIRAYNYIQKKEMDVYADAFVDKILRRDFGYVFDDDKYPGVPEVALHIFDNNPFFIGGQKIIPINVFHYKMPVFGFRINDFSYITDANYIPPEEMDKIRGSKVVVLNALRKEAHVSHFTLDEAVDIIQDLKPEKAFFTHISHQLGLHSEINSQLPAGIALAFDGFNLQL